MLTIQIWLKYTEVNAMIYQSKTDKKPYNTIITPMSVLCIVTYRKYNKKNKNVMKYHI